MNIENIAIKDIKPYERNAKKHPEEQVEHIANSIKEFGWQQPLVIDKDNVLIIGHGRLMAAKKLGLDTVPVIRAEQLSEEQVAALRLADNKTNESEWDFGILDGELDDIFDIDMSEFGFDLSKSNNEQLAEVTKDDEDYSSIHYLVSIGVDEHDKIAPLMQKCEELGAEVHMTRNDL